MNSAQIVVGAILVDSLRRPSRVLAARRSHPEHLAGRWEFPGGKVEAGESPEQALVRELVEELGIRARIGDELVGPWPVDDTLTLQLFLAVTDDQPSPGDSHDELRWLIPDQLHDVDWLPADAQALSALRARLAQ